MKLAVVFSGQGAQYPGMGKNLYETNEQSKSVFDKAPENIRTLCFDSTMEELSQTSVTQPCVYTMTMAAYAAFLDGCRALGVEPEMTAGFSLGECAALTASGVYDFETGIKLVTNRGIWMQEAAGGKGGMVAALAKAELVEECVEETKPFGMILAANYNSPKQTVVSGDFAALEAFQKIAKEKRIRAVPLKVGGPFHSPMLAPAAENMKNALSELSLNKPSMALYSNVTAEKIGDENLPELLSKQIMSPVRWEQTVRNMVKDGADIFVEIGPGKTLCGLIAKTDPSVTVCNVEDAESLNAALAIIKERLEGQQNA